MPKDNKAKDTTKSKNGKKINDNLPRRQPAEGEVGVAWLAKRLGIGEATVRGKLRNAEIETSESGAYSWPEAKAEKIAKQIASGDSKSKDKDADEKKGSKGKKAA